MWYATGDGIKYESGLTRLSFSLFFPDWKNFSGEIISLQGEYDDFSGYDSWTQHFSRDDEITLVRKTLESLKNSSRRVHIAGISCAESVDLIRAYYRECGYEDLAKTYTLPGDALVTVSINLRHLLWCEKDKHFLTKKDATNRPYYALVPPLRSPHDLRSLQQGARMGIVGALEVYPGDEIYIGEILQKQILTPYQMTQLLFYRWRKYGFTGSQETLSLELPHFLTQE